MNPKWQLQHHRSSVRKERATAPIPSRLCFCLYRCLYFVCRSSPSHFLTCLFLGLTLLLFMPTPLLTASCRCHVALWSYFYLFLIDLYCCFIDFLIDFLLYESIDFLCLTASCPIAPSLSRVSVSRLLYRTKLLPVYATLYGAVWHPPSALHCISLHHKPQCIIPRLGPRARPS